MGDSYEDEGRPPDPERRGGNEEEKESERGDGG